MTESNGNGNGHRKRPVTFEPPRLITRGDIPYWGGGSIYAELYLDARSRLERTPNPQEVFEYPVPGWTDADIKAAKIGLLSLFRVRPGPNRVDVLSSTREDGTPCLYIGWALTGGESQEASPEIPRRHGGRPRKLAEQPEE